MKHALSYLPSSVSVCGCASPTATGYSEPGRQPPGACSHPPCRATTLRRRGLPKPSEKHLMDQPLDALLGFAPDDDSPIPYMRRTREYYTAIGYTTPYRWAHYLAAPFTPLAKPLDQSKVAIITTAAPYQPGKGDQGPGAPYNGGAKFYTVYSGDTAQDHDLRISHIGYDRSHTTAIDSGTWFPLPALRRAASAGRIGAVAARFHGAPANRSHRVTVETDAPEILARVREDGADAVLIVPNCPVCHQTGALVARHLEAHGIPTVVMGCAKDIVEHAAAPRFLF